MSPSKANPDKKTAVLGVYKSTIERLKAAHAEHIGRTGKVSSLVEFTTEIIESGLKTISKKVNIKL